MRLTEKITSTFKRFVKAERGSTAVIFAVALVPILAAAGAAIDFISFYNTRNHVQTALDAGALAGATAQGATNSQRINIATAAFNSNMNAEDLANASIKVVFTPGVKTVVGSAKMQVSTNMMGIVGINSVDLNTGSEVTIPTNKNAEIAFVLDYSGSMAEIAGSQQKYIAVRDSVTKLINSLTATQPSKLKFALVPFSDQVYTDLPKPFVLGQNGSGMWTGCTLDNQYPYNLGDSTPSAMNSSKWGQSWPVSAPHTACSGYATRNLKIRPLSNNFTGIKSQIASMLPYAYTNISLGVQFGYQALSPNGAYTGAGSIASYNDQNTIKYLVLLTDGMQTSPAFGPGAARDVPQGETNLTTLCDNAKASGIHILTMAVGVDDAATAARLQDCATDSSKDFFVINTSDDMAQAFATITGQIAQQAYLSK